MAGLLRFTTLSDGWAIEGELDRLTTASLRSWSEGIYAAEGARLLELAELEIVDSEAIGAAIDAIRLLVQRTSTLTIAHAPHLLAHTLYRLGMLETGGRLSLFEPRQEEPYG